jgi:hypothetical protein
LRKRKTRLAKAFMHPSREKSDRSPSRVVGRPAGSSPS